MRKASLKGAACLQTVCEGCHSSRWCLEVDWWLLVLKPPSHPSSFIRLGAIGSRLFPSLVLQLQLPEESERLNVPPGENICLSGPLQGEQRLLEGALREGTASASVWALQTRACMKTPSPSYPLTFSSRRLCSGRCSNANISSSLRAPPGPRRLFNDCMFECAKSGWTAFRVGDSVHALACACLCLLELSTAVNASLAINISPSSWGQAKNRLFTSQQHLEDKGRTATTPGISWIIISLLIMNYSLQGKASHL